MASPVLGKLGQAYAAAGAVNDPYAKSLHGATWRQAGCASLLQVEIGPMYQSFGAETQLTARLKCALNLRAMNSYC